MKATIEFDLSDAKEASIYQTVIRSITETKKSDVQKVTKILKESMGDKVKLSPSEKGKLAAKTRWEKMKLAKDAEEKKIEDFQSEEHEEEVIDGRDILEGNFK